MTSDKLPDSVEADRGLFQRVKGFLYQRGYGLHRTLEISVERGVVVRDLAHQKWEAAGCPDGDGMEFWLKAENELASPVSRDDEQQTSGGFDDTVGF